MFGPGINGQPSGLGYGSPGPPANPTINSFTNPSSVNPLTVTLTVKFDYSTLLQTGASSNFALFFN
jgi:hypothetical protein